MSAAFTSAPARISCCTTASWPFRAARCRGVLPSCKQLLVRGLLHRLAQCTRQDTTPYTQYCLRCRHQQLGVGPAAIKGSGHAGKCRKHQIRAGPTLSAAPTLAPRFSSSRAVPAAPPYAAKCNGTHPSCDKAASIAPTPALRADRLRISTRRQVHTSSREFGSMPRLSASLTCAIWFFPAALWRLLWPFPIAADIQVLNYDSACTMPIVENHPVSMS